MIESKNSGGALDGASSRGGIFQHPAVVKGAIGIVAFVVVAEFFVLSIPLAWALSIPVTDKITIELGEIPQWVIAFGVAVGIWRTWKAEQKASVAIATAAAGVAEIKAVATQIDGLLAERDKAKVAEGEIKGKKAGADAAEQLAEGRRQGRDDERESVAAAVAVPAAGPVHAAGGKGPLPVADDRTATAGERVAKATERSADAATRVADIAEKP